jgi:hypothetical protein
MPKCCLEGCDNSTPHARGVAAAEGWIVIDLHGPGGNRYGNICPDHNSKDAKKKLGELVDSAVGK